MAPSDVNKILTELAVLKNKVDQLAMDSARVRRLEIAVVILYCVTAKTGLHQIVSIFGG